MNFSVTKCSLLYYLKAEFALPVRVLISLMQVGVFVLTTLLPM